MPQFGNFVPPGQKRVDRNAHNEETAYLRGTQAQPRQKENNPRDYDQIKCENGSGYSLNPFSVLKIEGDEAATWPERDDEMFVREGMRNGVESKGSQPGDDFDMVTVLQKSAPDEMFSQGVISGPTPVHVYFPTEASLDYPYAIPDRNGNKSYMVASPYGLNRILWHADPSDDFTDCTGETLQAYVNMGEDGQWTFWKLQNDLTCCGSATAKLCDECGTILQPDCPIVRTIYAPKGLSLCGCENSCGTWKSGDVVPAWWFEYLEKWVTIPNFHANLEEKEQQVVTSLSITGGMITPSTEYETVVTNVIVDTSKVSFTDYEYRSLNCAGSITLGSDVTASGNVTLTGNIGTSSNPIQLDVVSACDGVTITDASLSSSSDISLSGTMQTSATVNVPLGNLNLPVTGTCSGTASGTVTVSGVATFAGPLVLTGELPEAELEATVTISDSLTVTGNAELLSQSLSLSGGTSKTFSRVTGFTPPSLSTTSAISFNIPKNTGTISGSLSNATTTQVSTSGVTATIDLSSIFEEVDAVDPDSLSFTGCTLSWDTMRVLKLKSGASLSNIPVSLSGNINVPATVTGTCSSDWQDPHTPFYGVMSFTPGSLSHSEESVTVPTQANLPQTSLNVTGTATLQGTYEVEGVARFESPVTFPGASINAGRVTLSGNASLPVGGTISGTATGAGGTASGTASVSAPVTVSGPLNISSGVTISGDLTRTCPQYARGVITGASVSGSVSLPVSGSIVDSKICQYQTPTSLELEEGAITLETVRVALPSVDLTGATISGTTATIKYVGCKECPEGES